MTNNHNHDSWPPKTTTVFNFKIPLQNVNKLPPFGLLQCALWSRDVDAQVHTRQWLWWAGLNGWFYWCQQLVGHCKHKVVWDIIFQQTRILHSDWLSQSNKRCGTNLYCLAKITPYVLHCSDSASRGILSGAYMQSVQLFQTVSSLLEDKFVITRALMEYRKYSASASHI